MFVCRLNDDNSVQYGTVSIENNKLFVASERFWQTRRKLCLNMKVIPIYDSWGNLCRNEELAMSILFVKCSKCDGRMSAYATCFDLANINQFPQVAGIEQSKFIAGVRVQLVG